MKFTELSQVPKIIKEFYLEKTKGDLVLIPVNKPNQCSILDIERVISKAKPNCIEVIKLFHPVINETRQFDFFKSYLLYLDDQEAWEKQKDDFLSFEGSEFEKPEPVPPFKPIILTFNEMIAPYFSRLRSFKLSTAEITTSIGNVYDANEKAAARLTMAKSALDGQSDDYKLLWSLKTDPTGVMTEVTYKDLKEALFLTVENMSKNWSI